MNKMTRPALAIVFGVTSSAAIQAATLPNIDINRALGVVKNTGTALSGVSEKDEIALGRELAGRTLGAAPLINDRGLQTYVNEIGRLIAAQSDRTDLPWRFGVLDTPSVNAFAAPGGVILITRGLYEILDNEAQLAAVLGHEVAHVMKRHHVEVVRKQAGTQALAGAGQTYLQASGRDRTGAFDKIIGEGAEIFTRKLDQGAEFDADSVGLQLAIRAGYSPAGMIDVLQKLHARAGEPSTNLLYETHPHPRDRLIKVGDILEPQMANLPPGEEPPLRVSAKSLPRPVASGARAAPPAGRAMVTEKTAAPREAQQSEVPNALLEGVRSTRGGSGLPGAAEGLLRGILGR